MRPRKVFERFRFIPRRELTGAQVAACGGTGISQPLGKFGNGNVPLAIFRIELRDAHEACQRLVSFAGQFKCKSCGSELLDRLFRAILLLEQQRVSRDALRRLLLRLQKTTVQGQRLWLFPRGRKAVEQHSVIDGRAIWPILHRVEIAQRLNGF